jgi:rRNA maturation RNase YbeY
MITFYYETDFTVENESALISWIQDCITSQCCEVGEINYIFCDDAYLLKLNIEFLQHETLTDIISFDNTMGKLIAGDIFISEERVRENAKIFGVSFKEELSRVMVHGVLHFLGFKDKTKSEKEHMRNKENQALSGLKV